MPLWAKNVTQSCRVSMTVACTKLRVQPSAPQPPKEVLFINMCLKTFISKEGDDSVEWPYPHDVLGQHRVKRLEDEPEQHFGPPLPMSADMCFSKSEFTVTMSAQSCSFVVSVLFYFTQVKENVSILDCFSCHLQVSLKEVMVFLNLYKGAYFSAVFINGTTKSQ